MGYIGRNVSAGASEVQKKQFRTEILVLDDVADFNWLLIPEGMVFRKVR
jgi:hypothetical protein